MSDQELIVVGSAIRAVGEILIGAVVLSLHLHLIKQAILEEGVIEWLVRQRWLAGIGVALIVAGFIVESWVRMHA